MPKRVIDYEALWASDKLAGCAEWAQAEYAWFYGLADASGSFEITNLRVVWGRVAAIRKNLTLERLEQIFDEFYDKGLLFIWQQGGKRYAHWTGSDRPGRLPAHSWRVRLERLAPPVPGGALELYLQNYPHRARLREASPTPHDANHAAPGGPPHEDVLWNGAGAIPNGEWGIPNGEGAINNGECAIHNGAGAITNREEVLPNGAGVLPSAKAAIPKEDAVLPSPARSLSASSATCAVSASSLASDAAHTASSAAAAPAASCDPAAWLHHPADSSCAGQVSASLQAGPGAAQASFHPPLEPPQASLNHGLEPPQGVLKAPLEPPQGVLKAPLEAPQAQNWNLNWNRNGNRDWEGNGAVGPGPHARPVAASDPVSVPPALVLPVPSGVEGSAVEGSNRRICPAPPGPAPSSPPASAAEHHARAELLPVIPSPVPPGGTGARNLSENFVVEDHPAEGFLTPTKTVGVRNDTQLTSARRNIPGRPGGAWPTPPAAAPAPPAYSAANDALLANYIRAHPAIADARLGTGPEGPVHVKRKYVEKIRQREQARLAAARGRGG